MVSVQNLKEALEALKGGADIVDVKNLQEALVGSANPWVVKAVRDAIPEPHHASVTLGVSVRARNAWIADFEIMLSSTISTSGKKKL